jgi:ABC-type transport system involved in multi-copper enzyme maturation permease subunit
LSPVAEIRLITMRELTRSVRSVKGIAVGAITLLGAVAASFLVVFMQSADVQKAGSQEALSELHRQILEKQTGDAGLASYLASMPEALSTFLGITVWLGPLLVALLGFDLVAGELQSKSVRYWAVRSRRSSYFAGKLLGLWALVGLVTLVLDLIVDVVAVAKGVVTGHELLAWGPRSWLVAFLIAGAWAAIATFISSCFRQPIVALLTTFGTFFVLWVLSAVGSALRLREVLLAAAAASDTPDALPPHLPPMHWYEYLYPNNYKELLLSPESKSVVIGLMLVLAYIIVAIAGGSVLFRRRDI